MMCFLQCFVHSHGSRRPEGYPPDCLMCEVEIDNEDHNDCPFDSEYRELYLDKYMKWENVSETLNLHFAYIQLATSLQTSR